MSQGQAGVIIAEDERFNWMVNGDRTQMKAMEARHVYFERTFNSQGLLKVLHLQP